MNERIEEKKPPEVKPWGKRAAVAAGVFMPAKPLIQNDPPRKAVLTFSMHHRHRRFAAEGQRSREATE